jgi:hypothetical protein
LTVLLALDSSHCMRGPLQPNQRRHPVLVRAAMLVPLLLVCCRPAELPKGYVIRTGDEAEATPESRPVLLVADNQQHYLYGEPVWVRTAIVDRAVGTAIRAPQLDLFGPDVLAWVLRNHGQKLPVIHLGDGLNVSCVNEYDRFLATMDTAGRDWFMAPGNHDGIYIGSSDERGDWLLACSGGGGPIDQATFVARYLTEALAGRRRGAPSPNDPGLADFARQFDIRKGAWSYNGNKPALLERVAWHIDKRRPYRSFVVQALDVSIPNVPSADSRRTKPPQSVRYVLLDTANYESKPRLLPIPPSVNPGATGDITAQQLGIVAEWIEEWRERDPQTQIVLMGHHPFSALTRRAQRGMDQLRAAGQVLLYVSAHTHHGNYLPHPDDDVGWLELNIGSVVDWPLEFRSLQLIEAPASSKGFLYSNSELFGLDADQSNEGAPVCEPTWQPQLGEPDYYVDYGRHYLGDASVMARIIFDSLLHSYKRMLKYLPSEAGDQGTLDRIDAALARGTDAASREHKRLLLMELEAREGQRLLSPALGDGAKLRQDYRLCQAIWASRDDRAGVRRAHPKDRYIAFPKRTPTAGKRGAPAPKKPQD